MKKVLIVILVILLAVLAGLCGYLWYQNTHIFVEDAVYAIKSEALDLRGQEISFEHFDSVHTQLPDCDILWDVPFQNGKQSNDSRSIAVTSLEEKDLDILSRYFPNLQKLDGTGCKDYTLLAEFAEKCPQVEVVYQIDLGNISVEPDVTELTLNPGEAAYEALMENFAHLPMLETVMMTNTDFTLEQVAALQEMYAEITVDYTVEILGQEYTSDTAALDLSAMIPEDVEAVAAKLPMLPAVAEVELMDANGKSNLTLTDVKALQDAAGEAVVHYTFDFFGITVSTTDEEVMVKNKKIGDDNQDAVRQALAVMENCRRFVLDTCRLSDEVLAQIREEFRGQTKLVWRVWFGDNGSSLTDAEVVRAVYGLVDDNCHDLVYCEDTRYLDIGHNEHLDACDFIAGMPNLEVAILSGSPIKSIEPFSACTKLKFLELANCIYFTDLSPLANCKELEMLNLSYAKISDLSALDELPLTHMTFIHNKTSAEEEARFEEKHPDCWTVWQNGNQPYGVGWRYLDKSNEDKTFWYDALAKAFKYPHPNNNTGWYLN